MNHSKSKVNMKQHHSRRRFLRQVAAASVLGSGMGSMNGKLSLMGSALAAQGDYGALTDYKALVCVFLYGGSDSFNMFVPTDQDLYNNYAQSRGSLAIAKESLLGLNSESDLGFNPNMAKTHALFESGQLAVVGNVGNLIRQVDKADYLSQSNDVPADLFAHNHQQEQWLKGLSSLPSSLVGTGWGGRMADLLAEANDNTKLPPTFSLGGSNHWLPGNASTPISLNTNTGLNPIAHMNLSGGSLSAARANVLSQILSLPNDNILEQQAALSSARSISSADEIISALGVADTIQSPYNANSKLAKQLRMVARLIAGQQALGMQRQIFFVGMGGWDTHDNQSVRLNALMAELDESMSDFYASLQSLNMENAVTTFTASDFGRTLTVNGDGSDHGWGGHYMVMGGAVQGGQLYGQLPSFITGSDDDTGDKGRVIPSLSINQFGASLGSWMGISDNDLASVFPDLANFGSDWKENLALFT